MSITPNSGRCTMPDRKMYKAGDTFVLPVTFQVLKTMGHEDRVFHICAPTDNAKRLLCLKDPFFIVSTEPSDTDILRIPEEILVRANDFIYPEDPNPEEGGSNE